MVPAILFGVAAVVSAAVTYLLALESYLLFVGKAPITYYVRGAVVGHHAVATGVILIVVAVVVALVTHFYLDA